MKVYQRACLVIANEGISGLFRRIVHKYDGNGGNGLPAPTSRDEYYSLTRDFHKRALKLGYRDLEHYYWYHTIDLGNGLITPGTYDYRSNLAAFNFPDDMRGMSVLDIGSATGFFAFEFERRGATVTSVEIPSIAAWDRFPGQTVEQTCRNFERAQEEMRIYSDEQRHHLFGTSTLEELYALFLDGPFRFCHKILNSTVQRCYSRIYDLSKETLGRADFDLVFLGDVLVHTIDPLQALAAVAPLCRGILIIAQDTGDGREREATMRYIGGDKAEDNVCWWLPNTLCLEQVLRKLGFKDVSVVGKNIGVLRPAGVSFDRTIIHATK